MGNRVLDALVQGANVVNQAGQATTQTLAQMEANVAHQSQVRQAYTNQMFNALQTFQQAQMAENQLMVQKTFDIQNQYLNTLIKSNETYMAQRNKVLDLDLKIEQMKQDKYYKEQALKLDQIKTNAMVELYKAQTLKALGSVEQKPKAIPLSMKTDLTPKQESSILNAKPSDAVQMTKNFMTNLKGLNEFKNIRDKYKAQWGVDLLDEAIKQNPNLKYLFTKENVFKTYKDKDGKIVYTNQLNMNNPYLKGIIDKTVSDISTGNLPIGEGLKSIRTYFNTLNIDDATSQKIAQNVILSNIKLKSPQQVDDMYQFIKNAGRNINLSNTKETVNFLDNVSTFVKNNEQYLKGKTGNNILEAVYESVSGLQGVSTLVNDEHKFEELLQTWSGHDYNLPIIGYLNDWNPFSDAPTTKELKSMVNDKFGSKKAFVGYLITKAVENAKIYGADPLKVIKEPARDISGWSGFKRTFNSAFDSKSSNLLNALDANLDDDEKFYKFKKNYQLYIADVSSQLKQCSITGRCDENSVRQMVLNKVNNIVKTYDVYTKSPYLFSKTLDKNEIKKGIITKLTDTLLEDAKSLLNNKEMKNKLAYYKTASDVFHKFLDVETLRMSSNEE